MGLVKTRRLAAMQKQQRAKAGMNPSVKEDKAVSVGARHGCGKQSPHCGR